MLKVLLFDDGSSTTRALREAAQAAGCHIAGEIDNPRRLADAVRELAPDVVLMDVNSPSRDVLEQVIVTSRDEPRPIVMFTPDDRDTAITAALQAGVSAYIVDGIDPARINAILTVAVARFRMDLRLRRKLEETEQRLEERRLVERAKGIVMAQEKVGEDEAYHALRRVAMALGQKLADIARQVIALAEGRA